MDETTFTEFTCPRCSIPIEDGWELLAEGEVHHIVCQACKVNYNALIVECEACASDEVVTSLTSIDPENVICSNCGHSNYRERGGDGEDAFF